MILKLKKQKQNKNKTKKHKQNKQKHFKTSKFNKMEICNYLEIGSLESQTDCSLLQWDNIVTHVCG